MYIKKINISNFRNIVDCNIEPGEKINFIYGQNAQGKTNLLETIYFSSLFKSFRTNKNINLINDKKNKFSIKFTIINNNVNNFLEITLNNKNVKKIIINNKKPERGLIYKNLNSIIYYPDEISYLKAYPSYRRNLIDRSIFYIDNQYINLFKKYIKCLKQRNIFLKYNKNENDVWKEQLVEYGCSIIKERINYIEKINGLFDMIYSKNKTNENYTIEYNKYNKNSIKDDLIKKFTKSECKEKKYGYTLVGPHIDDFVFLINSHDINKYSSEGQKRSLLLSYKQAQLMDYKDNFGYYPILLFDDIGSELDSSRKKSILEKILENSGQVFITTMDFPTIEKNKNKIFEVNKGKFSELIID